MTPFGQGIAALMIVAWSGVIGYYLGHLHGERKKKDEQWLEFMGKLWLLSKKGSKGQHVQESGIPDIRSRERL